MKRKALILALLALPLVAHAAPSDELAKTKAEIKASEETQKKIAVDQENVEAELTEIQEKLVKAAAQIEANDAQLAEAEKKMKALEAELAAKEKAFIASKKKLDGLSRMAIRLSRTPPQAMVLMPADGRERIQAAHALAIISAEIRTRSQLIEKEMAALNELKIKVADDKARTEKIRNANKENKKTYEAALKNRKQLQAKLAQNRAAEEAKVAALAKKARSLEELITSLEREAKKPKKPERNVVSDSSISGETGKLRDIERAKGKLRVPASGRVVTSFNEKDATGNPSKGITISTRGGSPVVAPYDAEVAYTGTFLNYGKLVILKHSGDHHTLLAGVGRIDVKNGDFLLEGEPIGAMDGGDGRKLYVELRDHNQTVDPAKWMRGL